MSSLPSSYGTSQLFIRGWELMEQIQFPASFLGNLAACECGTRRHLSHDSVLQMHPEPPVRSHQFDKLKSGNHGGGRIDLRDVMRGSGWIRVLVGAVLLFILVILVILLLLVLIVILVLPLRVRGIGDGSSFGVARETFQLVPPVLQRRRRSPEFLRDRVVRIEPRLHADDDCIVFGDPRGAGAIRLTIFQELVPPALHRSGRASAEFPRDRSVRLAPRPHVHNDVVLLGGPTRPTGVYVVAVVVVVRRRVVLLLVDIGVIAVHRGGPLTFLSAVVVVLGDPRRLLVFDVRIAHDVARLRRQAQLRPDLIDEAELRPPDRASPHHAYTPGRRGETKGRAVKFGGLFLLVVNNSDFHG